MQLQDIWAECGRLLNDPNNDRWSTSVLTTRANLAQTDVQGQTKALKTAANNTPVAGTSELQLNVNCMNVIRATITRVNGSIFPFPGITRDELEFRYPDWQQWGAGEPKLWWFDAVPGKMNLVPIPDAANAISNGIKTWEVRKPADMVNPTDTPFDGSVSIIPYHIAIVHWVVAYCWMDDGTPESLAKAKFHKSGSMLSPGEYEKVLGRIMAEFDDEDAVPESILWRPEGARVGGWLVPTKSDPLPTWP